MRSFLGFLEEGWEEPASLTPKSHCRERPLCTSPALSSQTAGQAGSPELPSSLPVPLHPPLLLDAGRPAVPQSYISSFSKKECESQQICLLLCHCLRSEMVQWCQVTSESHLSITHPRWWWRTHFCYWFSFLSQNSDIQRPLLRSQPWSQNVTINACFLSGELVSKNPWIASSGHFIG